jgi:hypothetical protein
MCEEPISETERTCTMTVMEPLPFDMERAESFAGRVGGLLDAGAAAAMISVGHRLGLFDTLAELSGPATSASIAEGADLSERYVREWLAVMVMADIVEHDPATRTYRLPTEHAACLTRDAPLGNLAVYAQHIALFGKVEDRTLDGALHTGFDRPGRGRSWHHVGLGDGRTIPARSRLRRSRAACSVP